MDHTIARRFWMMPGLDAESCKRLSQFYRMLTPHQRKYSLQYLTEKARKQIIADMAWFGSKDQQDIWDLLLRLKASETVVLFRLAEHLSSQMHDKLKNNSIWKDEPHTIKCKILMDCGKLLKRLISFTKVSTHFCDLQWFPYWIKIFINYPLDGFHILALDQELLFEFECFLEHFRPEIFELNERTLEDLQKIVQKQSIYANVGRAISTLLIRVTTKSNNTVDTSLKIGKSSNMMTKVSGTSKGLESYMDVSDQISDRGFPTKAGLLGQQGSRNLPTTTINPPSSRAKQDDGPGRLRTGGVLEPTDPKAPTTFLKTSQPVKYAPNTSHLAHQETKPAQKPVNTQPTHPQEPAILPIKSQPASQMLASKLISNQAKPQPPAELPRTGPLQNSRPTPPAKELPRNASPPPSPDTKKHPKPVQPAKPAAAHFESRQSMAVSEYFSEPADPLSESKMVDSREVPPKQYQQQQDKHEPIPIEQSVVMDINFDGKSIAIDQSGVFFGVSPAYLRLS